MSGYKAYCGVHVISINDRLFDEGMHFVAGCRLEQLYKSDLL